MKLSTCLLSSSSLCVMGVLLVVMCSYQIGVDGITIHHLNWTIEGVRNYTRTSLRTKLGDQVILNCTTYSSLWIQTERIKYDTCNASAGTEKPYQNGFCLNGRQLILTLTMNSAMLRNDINYQDDQTYYLISFANGNLSSVFDDHGGQCEDGLKMILDIGQPKRDTQDNDKPDVPGEEKPPDQEKPILGSLGAESSHGAPTVNGVSIYIIIGAAAGGVFLLVCIVVITIVIVCCVKRSRSKSARASKPSINISFYDKPGPDSQSCTLTRAEFSLGSQAVSEVTIAETIQTRLDDVDASLGTFGLNLKPKVFGSVGVLSEKSKANSTATPEKSNCYDDATGQLSTTFHTNLTPDQKSKSITNVNYAPAHHKGRPKPILPPKPRQDNMRKSSSADILL